MPIMVSCNASGSSSDGVSGNESEDDFDYVYEIDKQGEDINDEDGPDQGSPSSLEICFLLLTKILNPKSLKSQKHISSKISKAQKPKSKKWVLSLRIEKKFGIFSVCF